MVIEDLLDGSAIAMDLARNKIVVNVPAYDLAGEYVRTKLAYFLDVYLPEAPGSASFELFETLEARERPVESNGGVAIYNGAFFEIQDLISGFLEEQLNASAGAMDPKFGLDAITTINGMTTPYYCVYRVEDAAVNVATVTLTSRWALRSGISEHDYAEYHSDFVKDYIGTNRRFLTNKPDGGYYQDGQPERLYWLHQYDFDLAEVALKTVVTYNDGAEASFETLNTQGIEPMGVYGFPVSCPVAISNMDVAKFTVYLVGKIDGGAFERISEVRYFKAEAGYRRNTKYVLFENAFGVFDLLTLHGQSATNVSVDTLMGEHFVGYDYLVQAAERKIISKSAMRSLSVAMHWINKALAFYLTDFIFARAYYLVTDRAHIPIFNQTDGYPIADDAEEISSRSFVFEYSNKESNFSDLPVKAASEARPTTWTPLSTACLLDANGKRYGLSGAIMLQKVYLDDGTAVQPREVKPNTVNEDGYLAPAESDSCAVATTPYKSAEYARVSDYRNTTCDDPEIGGAVTITIAAEKWGSELSQADADAKALAAWNALNTQAYANANGACILPNTNGLRAKFWNFISNAAGYGPAFDFTTAATHESVETNGNVNGFDDTFPDADTAGVNNDKAVVEFEGYLKAAVSGDVTLIANVDDGVRIWLGDVLILDKWAYNAGTSLDKNATAVTMVAGEFLKLKVRVYNESGFMGNTLSWKWDGQAKVAVPDLNLFYV